MTETDDTTEEPTVACTLTDEETETHQEVAREDFLSYYEGAAELADGYRLLFEGSPDALLAVADFVGREAECCSFASFRIEYEPPFEELALSFTGPEGTRELLREGFFGAFEEVSNSA